MKERYKNSKNKPVKLQPIKSKQNQKAKNSIEISSSENEKYKIIHENKLKEIDSLKKELNDIETQNESLSKEIILLKDKQNILIEKNNKINNETKNENYKLTELKILNEIKNKEYWQLLHIRI